MRVWGWKKGEACGRKKGQDSKRERGCADAVFAFPPLNLTKAANISLSCGTNSGRSGVKNLPLLP